MCFAVSVQPRPGTLCLEKCVAAGVKPGPLLGKLKAGEDIVLENGKIVRSADVTLPGGPSPTFLGKLIYFKIYRSKFLQFSRFPPNKYKILNNNFNES